MARQEGRTSDLIRRFESLGLDKGAAPPLKPPPTRRRASVASPSDADGTPKAALAAAQSVLSAAVAHTLPAPAPAPVPVPAAASPKRTSSIEPTNGVQPGAAHGSPRPQAAPATPKEDKPKGKPRRLLSVLNRRAEIDPLLQVSNSSWLAFAERCIDQGRLSQQNNDHATAYRLFMMACNIYTKKFGKLRDGSPVTKDPAYARLRKAVTTQLIDELEKLHVLLENRTADELETPTSAQSQPESQPMTAEQLDRMESRFSLLYPENPNHIAPDTDPADSGPDSGADSGIGASHAQQVAERQSRFDAIDAQVRSIDAGVQGLRSRDGALAGVAMVGQSAANNRVVAAVSPKTPAAAAVASTSSSGSPAPGGQTWFVDPNATTCTARELRGLIDRSRTGLHGRPTILVLDVRPHQDHVWGHIDHRHTVNVDPTGLRPKCTSADIASSLALLSDDQQRWFGKRDEFDLVVYVSQNMRSFSDANSQERHAMEHLNSAVYHYEYEKRLRRQPLFLVGGFDAWVQEVGPQRCRWSDAARRTMAATPQQPAAPAAPDRTASSGNVAAAAAVGDSAPSANGHHPAPRDETRHRPVHTSATHGYGPPQGMPSQPAAAAVPMYAQVQPLAAPPSAAGHARTVFDNPTYGFTGPAYAGRMTIGYPTVEPPRPVVPPAAVMSQDSAATAEKRAKRRAPPPVPVPVPQLPPKPAAYAPQPSHHPQAHAMPTMQQQYQYQQQYQQQPAFYNYPVAAGSDPSLNGRMHAGANLRNSVAFVQAPAPPATAPAAPAAAAGAPAAAPQLPRRTSQLSDTAAYGATGLKNFGNTCFMNSVIQCLIGTGPLTRYFMRGEWKRSVHRDDKKARDVTVELARLFENMWRGQYGSISPVGFRAAVANCSEQFKGNDQEDAHEFGSFLLGTLHETLNQVHPRPPADRAPTADEEMQIESMPDDQQAQLWWKRAIRRDWSIVSSIFQGQIQSRLTCLTCKHTSTTYHTFTELSVPIPKLSGNGSRGGAALVRKGQAGLPVNIYQCLDAYSETEVLDGDNKWQCPKCQAKRKATKRLMVARLPLVLIVHLKRFSTIGHFREKLETNVLVPTKKLYMQNYALPAAQSASVYNLYAVANHFGTLSSGHYTASVYNGLRDQWNYFDDTRVSPIPENQVATPAAYLLFFVQVQG